MGENSERPFDRRTVLKTIGGGIGLSGIAGVASANGNGGGGSGSVDALNDCLLSHAKYEFGDGGFSTDDSKTRGDVLQLGVDPLVNISVTDTNEDGEPTAFDWWTTDYVISQVSVKAGPDTYTKPNDSNVSTGTYRPGGTLYSKPAVVSEDDEDEIASAGSIDMQEDFGQKFAVSNVAFGKALYLQADVISGTDYETDSDGFLTGLLNDEDGEIVFNAAFVNSCSGIDTANAFEQVFSDGGIKNGDEDVGINGYTASGGNVDFSFKVADNATQDVEGDGDVGIENVDGYDNGDLTISLVLYEREGVPLTKVDREQFNQRYVDSVTTTVDVPQVGASTGTEQSGTLSAGN